MYKNVVIQLEGRGGRVLLDSGKGWCDLGAVWTVDLRQLEAEACKLAERYGIPATVRRAY